LAFLRRFTLANLWYLFIGVYKHVPEAAHIFALSSVSELRILTLPSSPSSSLIFGAAITLNEAIAAMEEAAAAFEDEFKYCTEIANHWKKASKIYNY